MRLTAPFFLGFFCVGVAGCSSQTGNGTASVTSIGGAANGDASMGGGGNGGSGAAGGLGGTGAGGAPVTAGGCGSDGWVTLDLGWDRFQLTGPAGGSFRLCHPSSWSFPDPPTVAGQPQLTKPNAPAIRMSAYLRLDHADAVAWLRSTDGAWCSSGSYAANYLEIGGWPALEQRYEMVPPACGACPGPSPTTPQPHIDVTVAGGDYVLMLNAVADQIAPGIADEILAIGRSVTVVGIGAPIPSQVTVELQSLRSTRPTSCP